MDNNNNQEPNKIQYMPIGMCIGLSVGMCVRTFNGRTLDESIKEQLLIFAKDIQPPFNIPVEFKFLGAKKDGLTCPVVRGTHLYVGGKIKNVPNAKSVLSCSKRIVIYRIIC